MIKPEGKITDAVQHIAVNNPKYFALFNYAKYSGLLANVIRKLGRTELYKLPVIRDELEEKMFYE
jgi:hypothetical protein